MLNALKKMMVTGLGAVFLTRDKIQEIVDELVEQGQVSRGEAEDLVEEMFTKAKQQREELEEKIMEDLKENLNKTGLTSQEEVEELKGRIKNLELQVEALEKKLEDKQQEDDA